VGLGLRAAGSGGPAGRELGERGVVPPGSVLAGRGDELLPAEGGLRPLLTQSTPHISPDILPFS